jgi:hypothetical protein
MEEAGSTDLAWYDPVVVDGRRYRAMVSRDPIDPHDEGNEFRWHISVSGEDATPRWSHLVAVVHHLRPSVFFVVGVPPRSMWMSVHPHCLHCWESRDAGLEEQFRFEALGSTPT